VTSLSPTDEVAMAQVEGLTRLDST